MVCVQRESFDVIGKVGFGRDFQASKDIDNPVNTFQQLTDDLEESVHRLIHPWRKYSLSKVPCHSQPHCPQIAASTSVSQHATQK